MLVSRVEYTLQERQISRSPAWRKTDITQTGIYLHALTRARCCIESVRRFEIRNCNIDWSSFMPGTTWMVRCVANSCSRFLTKRKAIHWAIRVRNNKRSNWPFSTDRIASDIRKSQFEFFLNDDDRWTTIRAYRRWGSSKIPGEWRSVSRFVQNPIFFSLSRVDD